QKNLHTDGVQLSPRNRYLIAVGERRAHWFAFRTYDKLWHRRAKSASWNLMSTQLLRGLEMFDQHRQKHLSGCSPLRISSKRPDLFQFSLTRCLIRDPPTRRQTKLDRSEVISPSKLPRSFRPRKFMTSRAAKHCMLWLRSLG